MKIEEGVMIVKNGKGWGVKYADGHSICEGWVALEDAEIRNPIYCKKPSDAVYKGSPDLKEVMSGELVFVIKKTIVEIKEK